MITDLGPKSLRAWAKDKPIEIRGAVSNYLGSLRRVNNSPNDTKAAERLPINRAVLERLAAEFSQPSEERKI